MSIITPTAHPLHSVSVAGAVIREDGKFLTIQRADNGNWEPPGGVLELDESPEEGVRCEVYAVRLLDALADNGPHVRSHDGHQLIATR